MPCRSWSWGRVLLELLSWLIRETRLAAVGVGARVGETPAVVSVDIEVRVPVMPKADTTTNPVEDGAEAARSPDQLKMATNAKAFAVVGVAKIRGQGKTEDALEETGGNTTTVKAAGISVASSTPVDIATLPPRESDEVIANARLARNTTTTVTSAAISGGVRIPAASAVRMGALRGRGVGSATATPPEILRTRGVTGMVIEEHHAAR